MHGRLDGSISFMCWVSSSASQDKKALEAKCFVQRGRSLFYPLPQLRSSFCWVTWEVTYIIYGQKAGLASFWMTGSRTKGNFPADPKMKTSHYVGTYCTGTVIWSCTDSLNWDYLYVTVIHLYMGFLLESTAMSQLFNVWKYVTQHFSPPLHREQFCFHSWHCSLLCIHVALQRVAFHPLAIGPGLERLPEAAQ